MLLDWACIFESWPGEGRLYSCSSWMVKQRLRKVLWLTELVAIYLHSSSYPTSLACGYL